MGTNWGSGRAGDRVKRGWTNVSSREQAVVKARDVITAWKACVSSHKTPGSRAVVDIKTEDLIEVLLEKSFDGDVSEQEVQQVFSSNGHRSTDEDAIPVAALRDVPEALIPVVIMREVLHVHRVMFNPKNVSNWRQFTQKFGKYMLAG